MNKTTIQLQSILFPIPEICSEEKLYYHRLGKRIDYSGYFNLFYIEKRKKYTSVDNVYLCIYAKGYRKLVIVHSGNDIMNIPLEPNIGREYKIALPYSDYKDGVFWFALLEDESLCERSVKGWYVGELGTEKFNQANVCTIICTYKREKYVLRNLRQLQENILDSQMLSVSERLSIYIIDNGQTLCNNSEIQAFIKDYSSITVIANSNTGGAGGFTRGILEALKANKFTHVILMDDDAVIEPDCFVRIYSLITTFKDEWKNMTIGGAMLREDFPHLLFCSGEWWERGEILNPNRNLDLRTVKTASCDNLVRADHEFDRYSGWWCCCYSLNMITPNNLPIPLFIHHDDIEFGLRNKEHGILFMNGICVWHKSAETIFPGSNVYYDIRNNLIEVALHQKQRPKAVARKVFLKSMVSSILRLKYKDTDLALRGTEDFLRGAGWLVSQKAEALHSEIRSLTYEMRSLEEFRDILSVEEYRDIYLQIRNYSKNFEQQMISNQRKNWHWLRLLTLNGLLFPPSSAQIKVIFPTDSPFSAFRMRKILLYEPATQKCLLIQRSYKEFLMAFLKFIKGWLIFEIHFTKAMRNYQRNIKKITMQKSWEKYLSQ